MTQPTSAPRGDDLCIVTDEPSQSRYEARDPRDGTLMGWLTYRHEDGVVVMPSTITLPEFRGRGVAAELTRRALEDAAASGRKVDAVCWYVAEYVERNPRYQSLQV